jgi:hypothetical protein
LKVLVEKITLKLSLASEAGKLDMLQQITITSLELGTIPPLFGETRLEGKANSGCDNDDLV